MNVNLRKLLVITAVMAYGLVLFMLGERVGELTAKPNNLAWLDLVKEKEKNIPDRVPSDFVQAYSNEVTILGDYVLTEYTDTNSMLPTLDKGSTGIQIELTDEMPLFVGDIISYYPPGSRSNHATAHRIVGIGQDMQGEYYITKGDNANTPDPYIIRRDAVTRVLVGIIY